MLVYISAVDTLLERRERRTELVRKCVERTDRRRVGRHEREHERCVVDVHEHDVRKERRHGAHGAELELADLRTCMYVSIVQTGTMRTEIGNTRTCSAAPAKIVGSTVSA